MEAKGEARSREVIVERCIEPLLPTPRGDDDDDAEEPSLTPQDVVNVDQSLLSSSSTSMKRQRKCLQKAKQAEGSRKTKRLRWRGKSEKGCGGGPVPVGGERYEDPFHSVLPTEVRCAILEKLHMRELLGLRAVSHKWRSTIDSVLKVNVRIDGNKSDFNGKCGLPIKSCQLVALQNPAHRRLFKSTQPEEVRISRGICQVNFEEMILQWSHLTKLELCWRSIMKNLLFGKGSVEQLQGSHIFPNLSVLKIEILTNDNLGEMTKQRILSNVTILTSYDYPSLQHCSMTFVGYRELHAQNRYLSLLLPFLAHHANSLQIIDVSLKYASHTIYPPAHPRHILFCVPANLKQKCKAPNSACDSQLTTTRLTKLNQSPEHHTEWVEMLTNRRRLEVAITTRFLNWTIKHLEFFSPTIRDYCKFLRRLELMNITMYDSGAHNTVTQLDAAVFRQCVQLVHLHIYRAPIIFHEDEIEPSTEMTNFHLLPKSLEDVVIDGLPIASAEILIALTELCNLRNFQYYQSQVPRRNLLWTNGVNWEVLQKLLKHPVLEAVRVHFTTFGNARSEYEEPVNELCLHFGWSSAKIEPGYINMYQVTLSRSTID